MTTRPPAWLSAWREGRGSPVPLPAPESAPAAPTAQKPVQPRTDPMGFTEPRQWPYDGERRREPVLDHDHTPPRVVRRVGWSRCLRCRRPFFSEDVVRLRLCSGQEGCRGDEDRIAGGTTGGSYRS